MTMPSLLTAILDDVERGAGWEDLKAKHKITERSARLLVGLRGRAKSADRKTSATDQRRNSDGISRC
jgi:hypothetical protein